MCSHNQCDKDCFDIRNVIIERGGRSHVKMIENFLNTHYWSREPTINSLWMPLQAPYLKTLTEMYSTSGDRLLAFEKLPRTRELKLIGVGVGNKVSSWMIDELEEWAHYTDSRPEKHRMYFIAHCLKDPDLFKKYNTDFIYEVQVLATTPDVAGNGVGSLLLRRFLDDAFELRYPIVQVIAVSDYCARICAKAGMKREWTMKYEDYCDDKGQKIFYPRRPHHQVSIYTKQLDIKAILRGEFKPALKPFCSIKGSE